MSHAFQVTFDANDPHALAGFWAIALGYVFEPPPPEFDSWDEWAQAMGIPEEKWNDARALVDPEGNGPRLFFQKVPEGKAAKNRVHLDINVTGRGMPVEERRPIVEAAIDPLLAAGATLVRPYEEHGGYWMVMQDPEGNEFCVQ